MVKNKLNSTFNPVNQTVMKIILLFLVGISSPAISQQPPASRLEQPASIDYFLRLGVEFEIKDNPSPNADMVRSIPFETYNSQRHSTLDLEIPDPVTNYIIILYSEERCRSNKQ